MKEQCRPRKSIRCLLGVQINKGLRSRRADSLSLSADASCLRVEGRAGAASRQAAKPPSITPHAPSRLTPHQPNSQGKLPPSPAAPGPPEREERRWGRRPPPRAWEGLGQLPSPPVSGVQLSAVLEASCPAPAHGANGKTEAWGWGWGQGGLGGLHESSLPAT